MEGASSPNLRQATTAEGIVSPEGDGRAPILTEEEHSEKGQCGICPQEEEEKEESGFSLRLGQTPDPLESASPEALAGPQRLLCSKDLEAGEPGGSWVQYAPETEVENMFFSKDVVPPDSLDHLFEFPGLFGGEPLSLVTQDPPQSPALYPEMLTGDSTAQQEAQPAFVVGSPGTSPETEGSDDKAQPGSRMELEQELPAPAYSRASSPEPLGALDDAPLEQRRPTHVKRHPWASPDDSSRDHPEESSKNDCPPLVSGIRV